MISQERIPLEVLLQVAAAAQLGLAVLNLNLHRLLGWKKDAQEIPLLWREVFQVHSWFISVTLALFAVLTWRFASEIVSGTNELALWLTGSIAFFWGLRCLFQFTYYSSSHWRGNKIRTLVHVLCIVGYGGLASIYGLAAYTLFPRI